MLRIIQLFIPILLLALHAPARAGGDLKLRAKDCTPLSLRKVNESGSLLHLATADQRGFIFNVRARRLEIDPEGSRGARARSLLSGDRRLRVTAQPDGTLRWFATSSNAERLALCLRASVKEWIVFTPGGYYDSSSGGDRLAGWELPNPPAASDFFPLALLKRHYQRAAVVSRMLSTVESESRLAAAEEKAKNRPPPSADVRDLLPPLIQVTWPPQDHSIRDRRLTLQVRVRSPNGKGVELRVSGASGAPSVFKVSAASLRAHPPQGATARGIERGQHLIEGVVPITVDFAPSSSGVEVRARAQDVDTESDATVLRLKWGGGHVVEEKPDIYLLSIGVSEYLNRDLKLFYAAKDATDFVETFERQSNLNFGRVEKRLLVNQDATRKAILDGFDWLTKQPLRDNDLVVLFLSGHGIGDAELGGYHFLPYDSDPDDSAQTMIAAEKIQDFLSQRKGGRALVFIDTCYSGSMFNRKDSMKELTQQIARSGNVVVYTSSTGGQLSSEGSQWGNGAFTKAVVEGLGGEADHAGTGRVTVTLLDLYVSQRVKKLTADQQTPTTVKPASIPDFDILKVPVPLRKRRWFWGVLGGVAASAIVVGGVILGTKYEPIYDRGNTGWLVKF